MKRRTLLASVSTVAIAASGCASLTASSEPAHTVTVYHVDHHEVSREVTVTVTDEAGEPLFEKEYTLSEDNESDEDATFPESTEPETIHVTVDDRAFEFDWPSFDHPQLPCEGENWVGIELWIRGQQGETPDVKLQTNCQHVMVGDD